MTEAEKEMLEGYRDGFEADALPPGPNRSAAYRHGWLNGRDDRTRKPRAPASVLRALATAILTAAEQEKPHD